MKFLLCPWLILTVCVNSLTCHATTNKGEWLEPRGNSCLTGVQPTPGNITKPPEIIAQYDLGRTIPNLTLVTTTSNETQAIGIVSGAVYCYDLSGKLNWRVHPPGLNFEQFIVAEDLNNDNKTEILVIAGRPTYPLGSVVLLDVDTGSILWQYEVEPISYWWTVIVDHFYPSTPQKQFAVLTQGTPSDKKNGYIAFFNFSNNCLPEQKWRYDFHEYTCYPTLLHTDIENDGIKEIAIVSHSRMWILDVYSGINKDFISWDVSPANIRSYGLNTFVDLDKNGLEDFLCIATFAQHHEVLLNKSGKLTPAWHYGWDESVTTGTVATKYGEPSFGDIDSDGKLEIILSMFNSEKDQEWLLRVYDAVDGTLKYRKRNFIVTQCIDIDDDGANEILGNLCYDSTGTEIHKTQLIKIQNGEWKIIWEDDTSKALPPEEVSQIKNFQEISLNNQGYIRRDDSILCVYMNPDKKIELREWKPKTANIDLSKIPAIQGPPFPILLAANILGDDFNEIILFLNEKVEILQFKDRKFEPQITLKSSCVPVLADLIGDETKELITVEAYTGKPPIVTAFSLQNENNASIVWQTIASGSDYIGLPQTRKAYARSGLFTGKKTPDIFVWVGIPFVRSICLEGTNGKIIWEKNEMENIQRFWGPTTNYAAAFDYDNNGKEDLIFTNPDYFCVADGESGNLLLGPLFPPDIFHQSNQGLYTFPAVLVNKNKPNWVYLAGGHYFQGAMTLSGEALWSRSPTLGKHRTGNEGFLQTPDGTWLIGFGTQEGNFLCISAANGTERWSFPIYASCSDIVTTDIDGNGTAEFIVSTSHGHLLAIGDKNGKPEIIWQTSYPVSLGTPLVADIDNDGFVEIIAASSDGYLNIFDIEDSL